MPPNLNQFIECWWHILLSVGHARLSLSLSSFFYRVLSGNALTGTIPKVISTLVKLSRLWVLTFFNEWWSCAPLSRTLKRFAFYLQVALWQPIGWDNPSSNICPGRTGNAVSPHFFYLVLVRASQHFNFNECWPCAPPNTHFQVFCHRLLYTNALTGTIPSEMSTLTNLNYLYAPSLIRVIECWSHVLLSVCHVRLSLSLSSASCMHSWNLVAR